MIQVGNHWAIARKWCESLTEVEIYEKQVDTAALVNVCELHSGRIRINVYDWWCQQGEMSVIEARSLASLLETAAAIAADWDSWKLEGDRT